MCSLQVLVKKFSTSINNQKDKVNQLDEDTLSLSDDISALKDKVGCSWQGIAAY